MASETIAAVSTPVGRGGIAVVRLSGSGLRSLVSSLTDVEVAPRRATLARFRDANSDVIDRGIVLFFPAPHSYTGEDVVELHAHGGPVVTQLLLNRCLELGARVAEPGEFTKRAFLNDKLDLAQAEGVADLIEATTIEAARCAVRSLDGEFSRRIDALVYALTELRVLVEATLDFPEEEIDIIEKSRLVERLEGLREDLAEVVRASRQGSLLREGIVAVLAGHPNVGKSSLLNRFAGSERAIVTDIPGTTRDTIHETVNLNGVPLRIVDTAGLRVAQDPVEKIGIARSRAAIAKADVLLWVADATRPATFAMDEHLVGPLAEGARRIVIANKIDLVDGDVPRCGPEQTVVYLSAKTGAGFDRLTDAVLAAAGWTGGEGTFLARARHLQALQLAAGHIDAAYTRIMELEFCAEELRLAQLELAAITGAFSADDLLGKIFGQFCIGK